MFIPTYYNTVQIKNNSKKETVMLISIQFQLFTLTDTIPVQYVGLDYSLEIGNHSVSLIMITAYHSYHFNQSLK